MINMKPGIKEAEQTTMTATCDCRENDMDRTPLDGSPYVDPILYIEFEDELQNLVYIK